MAEANHPPIISAQESSSLPSVRENNEAVKFVCHICHDSVKDPVLTVCGHLYCWPCLYVWLEIGNKQTCPVCMGLVIAKQHVIPVYGRGDSLTDTSSVSVQGVVIPERPPGQSPVRDSNLADRVRGLMVRNGFAPIASARSSSSGVTVGLFCDGEGQLNREGTQVTWTDGETVKLIIVIFVLSSVLGYLVQSS